MTANRLQWLAAAGAAVLAGALGVALLLTNGSSACAAPPSTSRTKGVATYFFLEGTLGSCSYPAPPADDLYVALGFTQYATAAACGTYIDVTGPNGKVRVKVIDSCPKCPVGHLDLSLTAFKRIADQSQGLVPITYRAVPDPEVPNPISVRVKEGSSQYWLSLLIDNHGTQLTSVRVDGHPAQREEWNYWTLPTGAGRGPFQVKTTDVAGRTVTIPNVKLAIGRTQKPPVRKAAPKPAVRKAAPKPTPAKPAVPKPSTTRSTTSTPPAVAVARSSCG